MKRDMQLVREILLAVEADTDLNKDFKPAGYPAEAVAYHVRLLIQAKLITSPMETMKSLPFITKPELTWEGHDFLDAARNDTTWNKVIGAIREKAASVPFDVLR